VLSAIDADVIKTYVETGLGIGIIASMAFNPEKDHHLRLLPANHLFQRNTTFLAVHRGAFLRDFARDFVLMMAPGVSEDDLRQVAAG